MPPIRFGQEEYDVVDPTTVALSKVIAEAWNKLGKPQSVFSVSGAQLMDFIIDSWQEMYPHEYRQFKESRKQYQDAEMDIKDQVKQGTGRSIAVYPPFIHRVMKKIFTEDKFNQRETVIKLVKKWPMFRQANKI